MPMNPALKALLGNPAVGDVKITPPLGPLGLPSVGEEQVRKWAAGMNVTPEQFANGEYILMGISAAQLAGGITVAAGAPFTLARGPATPLLPLQLVFASTIAPGLFISQIKIGAVDCIDGDPVAAEVVSEVSLANKISWPTVQTSQIVQILGVNASAAPITNVQANLLGWRVRP